MSQAAEIQYISDSEGNLVGVIVPINLWREIESERETAYLLKSETMKRRLLEAKERHGGYAISSDSLPETEEDTVSFLEVAQSLHLKGPSDWSARIEDYLGEKHGLE